MNWMKPEATLVKMDAEISSYQGEEDRPPIVGNGNSWADGVLIARATAMLSHETRQTSDAT
jgi:hypothetical protein